MPIRFPRNTKPPRPDAADTERGIDRKAAIRHLAVMRGQLSCFQRRCVDVMNAAGKAPATGMPIGKYEAENAGEIAFELMVMTQILQKATQDLSNQLREQEGMPLVDKSDTAASVDRMLDRAMDDARAELNLQGPMPAH